MPASLRSVSPDAADIDADLALEDLAVADADCIGALACGRRSSFSYRRLPDPPLRLTVRKLDASSFDVPIGRSATVAELKAAVEDVFFAIYDDAERAISWQQVWSHFCLCFKDEKLTDDKATLRAFGIRDGDELHFAQHLSVDDSRCKSPSKDQTAASHRRSKTSLDDFSCKPRTFLDDLNEDEDEKFTDMRRSTSVLEEDPCGYQYNVECMEESRKKGSFFRGWFSYSRLRSNRRTHAEYTVLSSCEEKIARPKLGKWLSLKKSKT
ncbi:hypothetical protein ACP70R_028809 [Stipagrostis hirtigluma subsp. patula]